MGGPDSEGPPLVLRHRARAGQLGVHHEHVLQQERRQPERVALRARHSRGRRSTTRRGRTPAAASPRRSRRATSSTSSGTSSSVCASCENGGNYANAHDLARGQRLRRPAPDAVPAGDVDFAGQQQAAARRRLRLLLLALGRPREGGSRTPRTWCASSSSARRAAPPTATSRA